MADQVVGSDDNQTDNLSAEQVVAYLRQHPGFFEEHDYLLAELTLPHASGRAISLMEKQVHLFREQRDELRQELAELINIARHNDRLFDKSKRLLMALLEAQTLDEVAIVMQESIRNDFGLPHCQLVLFGDAGRYPTVNIPIVPVKQAGDVLGVLMESSKAVCGRFSSAQLALLFAGPDQVIGSAAVIPLRADTPLGMLSIGSDNADYFDSSMGSLFLSYISDTLNRLLPPMLVREQSQIMGDGMKSFFE